MNKGYGERGELSLSQHKLRKGAADKFRATVAFFAASVRVILSNPFDF
jgi:hypothetical protein